MELPVGKHAWYGPLILGTAAVVQRQSVPTLLVKVSCVRYVIKTHFLSGS
jgi:hypothetical protein